MLIPSALEGEKHPSLEEVGLPQVFHNMELLGGAMECEFSMEFRSTPLVSVFVASMKRLEAAEALAKKLIHMMPHHYREHRIAQFGPLLIKFLSKH